MMYLIGTTLRLLAAERMELFELYDTDGEVVVSEGFYQVTFGRIVRIP